MAISITTLNRLCVKAGNKCAMPKCSSPLVIGDRLLAKICHIRERRKGGWRYDPDLSVEEKDEFHNLILLCPDCCRLVEKDRKAFTVESLTDLKAFHERGGPADPSKDDQKLARQLFDKQSRPRAGSSLPEA